MSKGRPSLAKQFALGGAAAASLTALAPFERVKLLLQCQNELVKQGRLASPYKGLIDCTRRTFRSEGILPFWRGNLVGCIAVMPVTALTFVFKDSIKRMSLFKAREGDASAIKFTKNVASGGVAGFASLSFLYSLAYCHTRLANDVMTAHAKNGGGREFRGIIDVYRKTLKTDGFVGLYRGFVVSCFRILVYRGCYFGLYDTLKPLVLGDMQGKNIAAAFCLGYGVTFLAGTLAYPLDTIRCRMMMTTGQPVKYNGSVDCFLQITRAEGVWTLYKGFSVIVIPNIIGAAVLLVSFDRLKERRQGCARLLEDLF